MDNRRSLLAGAGLGAGLTYFLDPGRGARRRARVRDAINHATNLTGRAVATTGRDALHRGRGAAAVARGALRHEAVDDLVLVERVRAQLGRLVSHPHAVEVQASQGVVTLRGPILAAEAARLIRGARAVRGVRSVLDDLDVHEQPGRIPALQGGRVRTGSRRLDVMQRQWAPTTRMLVGAAGALAAAAGVARRDTAGAVAAVLGTALVARAAVNVPTNRLVGVGSGRPAVDVRKTITINAPVSDVFAFWSWYENFPRFMSRVLAVKSVDTGSRSHWKVAGPAGMPVTFAAEVTRVARNQLIEWRSLPGSVVAHAGRVRFDAAAPGRTRVHIQMSYSPPAGWFGHSVAAAFGVDPKSSMDADLARMKTLIETGNAPHDAAARPERRSTGNADRTGTREPGA